MTETRVKDVWDEITDSPEEAQAMRLRAQLMLAVEDWIKGNGMTQSQAAKALGETQPRISALMAGKVSRFSLDTLVMLLRRTGQQVNINLSAA